MNTFYEKIKKWDRVGVTAFSLLFMTVGFLQLCSLTFGKPIISWVQWPTVALGALLVILRLINFKRYKDTRGIWIWALFTVSFAVSAVLFIRYGFRNNARMLAFLVFQFVLLYAGDRAEDKSLALRRLKIVGGYFLAGTTVMSLGSLLTMILGISQVYFPEGEGPVYYVGFQFGRLFGLYWDPNIGSLTAVVAVLLSLHYLLHKKGAIFKVLWSLSLIIQLCYISLSGSRTGELCLTVGITGFVLVAASARSFSPSRVKQTLAVLGLVVLTAAGTALLPSLIQKEVIFAASTVQSTMHPDEVQKKEDTHKLFERGYDLSTDVTNRRLDIWRAGLEISGKNPVFGVSRANILPYVDENLPDSYLVTNDHMRFDSMHNAYVEILVSQGAVGLVLFLAGALSLAVPMFRRCRVLTEEENAPWSAVIVGILAATLASTVVMAEVVYVISPVSTMFWLSAGALDRMIPWKTSDPALPGKTETGSEESTEEREAVK